MAPRKSAQRTETVAVKPVVVSTIAEDTKANAVISPSLAQTFRDLWSSYLRTTSKQLKLIDAFQLFLMLVGVTQFLYCCLITNFPFNAFLGGFSATVGQFVLCASLRSQVNPQNTAVFSTITPERAFGDFLFGSVLLHFFVFNYLG